MISLLSRSNPLKLTFIEKNDAISGIFDGAVDVGDNEMGPTGFFDFEKFHNYRLDAGRSDGIQSGSGFIVKENIRSIGGDRGIADNCSG